MRGLPRRVAEWLGGLRSRGECPAAPAAKPADRRVRTDLVWFSRGDGTFSARSVPLDGMAAALDGRCWLGFSSGPVMGARVVVDSCGESDYNWYY